MKKKYVSICFLFLALFLLGCGPGQLFGPTVTPTFTLTPVPTSTPTLVPTATSTPTPVTQTFTVVVPANELWFNTDIKIKKGQEVTIQAEGIVNTWEGRRNSDSDPGGQTNAVCNDGGCPMVGAYYGELIGRLGVGTPFQVDASLDFTAPGSGTLFLTVNDWSFKDNKGEFNVTVTVK